MATYGGDLSLRHFLALEVRAIPFEVAHVLGNVVLALVAGPAMVRMLTRFRERFEWERRAAPTAAAVRPLRGALRSGGVAALLLLALLALGAPARAGRLRVERGADWLESQQRPDGGFAASAEREARRRNNRLGDAGAGGCRTATRSTSPAAANARRLPPQPPRRSQGRGRPRPHDPRPRGRRRRPAQLRRRQSGRAAARQARATTAPIEGWPGTTAFAVIALRGGGRERSGLADARLVAQGPGQRRRLGDVPGSPSTADVTGAVLQALTPGSEGRRRGRRDTCASPARRRRLRARRQRRRQRPVDRLGIRGHAGGRQATRPASAAAARARSTTSATCRPKDGHFLKRRVERTDPGLGNRQRPGRRRRRLPPDSGPTARTANRNRSPSRPARPHPPPAV